MNPQQYQQPHYQGPVRNILDRTASAARDNLGWIVGKHDARTRALLAQDPSIAPLLEKKAHYGRIELFGHAGFLTAVGSLGTVSVLSPEAAKGIGTATVVGAYLIPQTISLYGASKAPSVNPVLTSPEAKWVLENVSHRVSNCMEAGYTALLAPGSVVLGVEAIKNIRQGDALEGSAYGVGAALMAALVVAAVRGKHRKNRAYALENAWERLPASRAGT